MRVEVFDGPDSLAEGTADLLAELLSAPGEHSLGLAGGSTPQATYTRLAKHDVKWDAVDFWLGDERWVPSDSPDSNAGMARRELTGRVGGKLHEVPYSEDISPAEAADAYESTLRGVFARSGGSPDVVLLGLGEDGHTASLFPGTSALDESERAFVANFVPKLEAWRLTATASLLQRSRRLIFLVSGNSKDEAARLLVNPGPGDPRLPSRIVIEGAQSEPIVMLDDSAAATIG